MRDARFAELDRLIAQEPLDVLAQRVLRNEKARHGNTGRPVRRKRPYRPRSFQIERDRHPLDRRFYCGFDSLNVSIKQYVAHIRACPDAECQGRLQRWFDLGEYFKRRA